MSGIAGVVMPAGCAIDERCLQGMAASMRRRGPDGEQVTVAGRAGLVHTLLRTGMGNEAAQPVSLDGEVWITADARLDGRADLVRALEAAGRVDLSRAGHAQLILHAYHAWGEHCVDHLIGDFAFAIWDGRIQRLFCARDHFGVKPFYYAETHGALIFSNTLDCLQLHPRLDRELNELSIADFLLFGFQRDPSATAFSHIRRLPPAHVLSGTADGLRVRRYWTLPADGRIRYRRPHDYIEHFTALFRDAVGDRIDGGAASIWLSGGLDSASIAVTARQVVGSRGTPFDLTADTVVYDTLIRDDERRYAAAAGAAAGIAPRFWPADAALPFAGWHDSAVRTPEPTDDPYFASRLPPLRAMAATSRGALSGDGGDELLWRSYAVDLVGKIPLFELGSGIARCVLAHRRRPALGVRARLLSSQSRNATAALPTWLSADLIERWRLRERVREAGSASTNNHPLRPEAYDRLSAPAWPAYLETADPGFTGIAVEQRWPFLDLRLVNYVLAIPPLPWCVDKVLLRRAMRNSLPPLLLHRGKTALAEEPLRVHLRAGDWSWLDRFEASPHLARFVDRAAVPAAASLAAADNPWSDLRPFCLNYWLSRDNRAAP